MRESKYTTPEERKAAQNAAATRWRARNREKSREAVKRWRKTPEGMENSRIRARKYAENHREQERIRAAKWRKDNPEKARKLDRLQYLKSKDAMKEYNRKYRAENRETVSLWGRNRKARKRAGGGRVTRKFVLQLFVVQGGRCSACKTDFAETGYQIDHVIPLSKGGDHANWNIQLLCPTCNKRKSDRDVFEFLRILEVELAKL